MTDLDCRTCRDYRGCKHHKEWFHYGEIRWCPYQVLWILRNKAAFEWGEWPKPPEGFDDNRSRTNVPTEAYYCKAKRIYAELGKRLRKCDRDAGHLITQVEDGRTLNSLSPEAREVLMYVKGYRRKHIAFRRWLREVYYRRESLAKSASFSEI